MEEIKTDIQDAKLIVLVGISGSDKSFWAHQEWLKDPLNTVIVSRDNIRGMFGYTEDTVHNYYDRKDLHKLEEFVTDIQDALIREGLFYHKKVIVDNTHLKPKYLRYLYELNHYTQEFVIFDKPMEDCIERDSLRVRKVGKEIIKRQHQQFQNVKKYVQENYYGGATRSIL